MGMACCVPRDVEAGLGYPRVAPPPSIATVVYVVSVVSVTLRVIPLLLQLHWTRFFLAVAFDLLPALVFCHTVRLPDRLADNASVRSWKTKREKKSARL